MTASLLLPPALPLLAGALLLARARGPLRAAIMLLAPLCALALAWTVPEGTAISATWMGYEITPLRVDRLSRWFGIIFALIALLAGLFALRQPSRLETAAAQAYAGGALGVVFAGDLLTLFVFWEVMALASTLVIWSAGTTARAAGFRYVLMHLLGGVLLMMGLAGEVLATGTTSFGALVADTPARWLILLGVLINAGAPPFSAWLPDAYPRASWSGTVVLSAFTTKTAIYVLLRGFPGTAALIWIGLAMTLYGILWALLENDIRRTLAYSIITKVGFMVAAIGIGTPLALDGAAALALSHIIDKALLLMAAGAVLLATGHSRFTELGGLWRSMPLTTACTAIGALALISTPLTAGFVTKSLITDAAAGEGMILLWYALTAASAGVVLQVGLRFPWFVFFGRDSGLRPPDPPWNMRLAMLLLAAVSVLLGVTPGLLHDRLPFQSAHNPYDAGHVLAQIQLLAFAGLAFFLLRHALRPVRTSSLDFDWLYRRAGRWLWERAAAAVRAGWRIAALAGWTLAVQAGLETRLLVRRRFFVGGQASSTMATVAVAMLILYLALALLT